MIFNSLAFIIFLTVVLTIYYRIDHRKQNVLLLISSYVFYGWWDYRFLSLLLLSTVVDYYCAQKISNSDDPKLRRFFLNISLCTNLGCLALFKYFNFFADSAIHLLNRVGMEADPVTLNVILPVGISFYTFQTLSYTIDVYRGKCAITKNLLDFAVYVSFFPQLVAGPIERASHLLPQVSNARKHDTNQIIDGIWLILVGYVKKIVIADWCGKIVDSSFSGEYLPYDGAQSWIFIYAFAFQIYGDFAGYTDIARGVSKLLGFDLMLNFGKPYFASNPSEFWRHWHISLSSWLRDYLYIPVGGSRGGTILTYRNLLITMVLGGLWHGAGWAFLIWGFYHGILLSVHRACGIFLEPIGKFFSRRHSTTLMWRIIITVIFFHFTCIGWLIFRAGSIPTRISGNVSVVETKDVSKDKGELELNPVEGGSDDQVSPEEVHYVSQKDFIFKSIRVLVMPPNFDDLFQIFRVLFLLGGLALLLQWKYETMECFHKWSPRYQIIGVVTALCLIATLGVYSGSEFIYFQF